MIHKTGLSLAVVVTLATVVPSAMAVPIFYLSTDPLGVASPGIPNTTIPANSTGTINIFATSDVRLSGISLNLVANGSAMTFTGASVNNPNSRWTIVESPVVAAQSVLSIGGGAIPFVSGNGIGPDSPEAPNGVSGYLLGSVNYTASATAGAMSELFIQVGGNTIADWDGNSPSVIFGPGSPGTPGDVVGGTDTLFDAKFTIQGAPPTNTPPTLLPIVRNHSLVTDPPIVDLQLTATDAEQAVGDLVWSNLVYAGGPGKNFGGAADATMDADGLFDWNPAGWRAGVHTFNATVNDGQAQNNTTTGLVLTVNLTVPEPATFAMLGLAMVGVVGLVRRRS